MNHSLESLEQLVIDVMEAEDGSPQSLPPKVQMLLKRLLEERKELLERIKTLEEKAEQSEEKANQNSRNSSKPPSQDPVNQSKKTKARGVQKGHPKAAQPLFETSKCKDIFEHYPEKCLLLVGLIIATPSSSQIAKAWP